LILSVVTIVTVFAYRTGETVNGFTTGIMIIVAGVSTAMPKTVEAKCTNQECELDMMELHYTYDMSDDTTVDDFVCPYCQSETLDEIVV
jgi:hypothetical protein